MKVLSTSLTVALLTCAASAFQQNVDVAGSLNLVDGEIEAADALEGDNQSRGPLFDRFKGMVSRSKNASQQAGQQAAKNAQEATAKVAVLAKEASAKAEAKFRTLFKKKKADATEAPKATPDAIVLKMPARREEASSTTTSQPASTGDAVLRANATATRPGNATHKRHSNATAGRGNATAAKAAKAARKAAALAKYVTAPERVEKAAKHKQQKHNNDMGGKAKAVGDPHMTNIKGQRFDLAQPGAHTLVLIPRFARLPSDTLLRVEVDVRHIGSTCEDIYIQQLNVTGMWVTTARDGLHFHAGRKTTLFSIWHQFFQVELKVVDGKTKGGIPYLNFFVRGLGHTGQAIGGLLGDDDHTFAATKSKGCGRTIALLGGASSEEESGDSERSEAEASL